MDAFRLCSNVEVSCQRGGGARRCKRYGTRVALATALSLCALPARAEPAKSASEYRSLAFSNLVFRLEEEDITGVAREGVRLRIIEALRARGFNVVGAGDLVFGRDDSDHAEMTLGGTVLETKCFGPVDHGNCRIGVEWLLRSERESRVVYEFLSRFNIMGASAKEVSTIGRKLVLGALGRLMDRPRFRAAMQQGGDDATRPEFAPGQLQKCSSVPHAMPGAAESVLAATVLVRAKDGFGSGFAISPDGYLLTAEHVVRHGEITVQTRSGRILPAQVLRADGQADVALLKIPADSSSAESCLGFASPPGIGAEVYAIGAPAGEDLAFSLTRGILSGRPTVHGVSMLQTDASVSPGNSGGPLVDSEGRVIALVSAKLAGGGVEGIAFGIPAADALGALEVSMAEQTDPALAIAAPRAATAPQEPFVDGPDRRFSVDPEGDRDRLQSELTPGYVGLMKWGGIALGSAGLLTILVSSASHAESNTYADFTKNRTANDLGWAGLGLGLASFVGALILTPSVSERDLYEHGVDVSLGFGPASTELRVLF